MKKLLLVSMALVISMTVMFSSTVSAVQQGQHKGNKLNVDIEYTDFFGYKDYSYLGLGDLPVYYIGGTTNYTIDITNGKNNKYNYLVILVTHREYLSGNLLPGYSIDPFSGLPYHNIVYMDTMTSGESFDLSYWVPWSTPTGADQTDVVIYRGYNQRDGIEGNEWSNGRIIFDGTIGYFCPPVLN
ncbi:MAG: hypothetical protein ABIF08_00930 [Nanoarchaeota archaeon]